MTKAMNEYFRIYAPWEPGNHCCVLCKKCIDGCSWANEFVPVKGWKARMTLTADGKPYSYKIFYCPEFEEGDAAKGRDYDKNGYLALLEAVYHDAANDYKKAYKRKLKAERRNDKASRKEIESAEGVMHSCSFLLDDWTEKLKKVVEEEMAQEEGKADVN
jgi:hypothetical protein